MAPEPGQQTTAEETLARRHRPRRKPTRWLAALDPLDLWSKLLLVVVALCVLVVVISAVGLATLNSSSRPASAVRAEADPGAGPSSDLQAGGAPAVETPNPPPLVAINTPVPLPSSSRVLLQVQASGDTSSESFVLPACQKAVFFWTLTPDEEKVASLVIHLHRAGSRRAATPVDATHRDSDAAISGATLHPLAGGEYTLSTENTRGAWALVVECQDAQTPQPPPIDVVGTYSMVTQNYGIPACAESVFHWSVQPDETGLASVILSLHEVGGRRPKVLVNEVERRQADILSGQAEVRTQGGEYFLSTENLSGPWTVRWECRQG